jgi:hypothetical protein
MKQQFVITLAVRQTEIPAYEALGLQTHYLSTCCVHKKIVTFPYTFVKT